jgi:chemotaxis protein methyltransferase CheR
MAFLAGLLKARSGLMLPLDKAYLVETRLGPVARKEGFGSTVELIEVLRLRPTEALAAAVTDAMSNTETWFFRDRTPFDQFRDEVLPALARARPGGTVRVWCAGVSTGQEAYSLAMLADEASGEFADVGLQIVATDLSRRCLEKAHAGLYTQFEVQRGLPIRLMVKHFGREEENWRISARLRGAVRFRVANLLDDASALGRFDAVFCRNVLSGFDEPTRSAVLERIAAQLADDGVLVLGAAETVHGLTDRLKPVPGRRGLYVQAHARRAAA